MQGPKRDWLLILMRRFRASIPTVLSPIPTVLSCFPPLLSPGSRGFVEGRLKAIPTVLSLTAAAAQDRSAATRRFVLAVFAIALRICAASAAGRISSGSSSHGSAQPLRCRSRFQSRVGP